MKRFLSFCMVMTSLSSFAQYYNINPVIRDSVNSSTYFYHVSGVSSFSDSLVLHVELVNDNEELTKVFVGDYNFISKEQSGISNFNYSAENQVFSFEIGNYLDKNLILHMWVSNGSSIENEIYFKQD